MRSLQDFKGKKHKTNTGLTFVTIFKGNSKVFIIQKQSKVIIKNEHEL